MANDSSSAPIEPAEASSSSASVTMDAAQLKNLVAGTLDRQGVLSGIKASLKHFSSKLISARGGHLDQASALLTLIHSSGTENPTSLAHRAGRPALSALLAPASPSSAPPSAAASLPSSSLSLASTSAGGLSGSVSCGLLRLIQHAAAPLPPATTSVVDGIESDAAPSSAPDAAEAAPAAVFLPHARSRTRMPTSTPVMRPVTTSALDRAGLSDPSIDLATRSSIDDLSHRGATHRHDTVSEASEIEEAVQPATLTDEPLEGADPASLTETADGHTASSRHSTADPFSNHDNDPGTGDLVDRDGEASAAHSLALMSDDESLLQEPPQQRSRQRQPTAGAAASTLLARPISRSASGASAASSSNGVSQVSTDWEDDMAGTESDARQQQGNAEALHLALAPADPSGSTSYPRAEPAADAGPLPLLKGGILRQVRSEAELRERYAYLEAVV
ncbi:hypothetical protein CXG81DRAFT_27776 [Caulochytrium protostelioides]|uniref:Uncharacterized protein n=1 Tax=Caulochytrium protostelioides TaxID=1555241 RepID=A0A4P9X366_9FUNG|nr:hypothetical protein CXG81DRAFT_27776 [Caulochytrium protostelioides]|eukprot:RKO99457.1 hypothetical protein CXG81DRAFT_27776 [Caulochytrium protostelioides]